MSKIDYEITVDVRGLSVEEKKKVQDAFFKLGFFWATGGASHQYTTRTDLGFYTNAVADNATAKNLMFVHHDEPEQPTHTPEQLFELAGMNDAPEGMEPFDLERALAGEPVVTRDGREATQIKFFDGVMDGSPVAGVVGGFLFTFSRNGESEVYNRHLFMVPKTHTVNGFEVPAPLREPLKFGEHYYMEVLSDHRFCTRWRWSGDCQDKLALERGIAHSTQEAAIANAKARLGIDPQGDDHE